jgi:hypothetical protein
MQEEEAAYPLGIKQIETAKSKTNNTVEKEDRGCRGTEGRRKQDGERR